MRIERNEPLVQRQTLLLQHADSNLNARVAQLLHATSLHLGKGIDASADHTAYMLADDQIGTRRCLAPVTARLQRYVNGGSAEQCLVLRLHGSKGVDLSMSLPTAHMVSLADDAPVAADNHRANHWVRLGVLSSVDGKFQAAPHVFFICFPVDFFCVHSSKCYSFIIFAL